MSPASDGHEAIEAIIPARGLRDCIEITAPMDALSVETVRADGFLQTIRLFRHKPIAAANTRRGTALI
jgi:hypothetical protein